MFSLRSCLLLALVLGSSCHTFLDPNEFCFGCQSRRNHKDLYANPDDCHTYYQCSYDEDNTATGTLRPCPPLSFWHDQILQCMPEGSTPCSDVCMNSNYNTGDCYAATASCSTYFVCDNTASVQMCCPQGTRFNATKCGCDGDDTCTDICIQPTRPPTTVNPASNDGVTCIDSFGNTLQAVDDNAAQFQLIDADGAPYMMNCAEGTAFSLVACRCDFFVDVPVGPLNKQCSLYLPFDDDFADHSHNRFSVFEYGTVTLRQGINIARGKGAALFGDGWLEIPGMKTFSPGQALSICFFYRCLNSSDCPVGGIFSNRKGPNAGDPYSFYAASTRGAARSNQATISLSTNNGAATLEFDSPTSFRYVQVCAVYDGAKVTIYSDSNVVAVQPLTGDITIGSCPFAVGTDQVFGNFSAYIDEILVCPRALSRWEVNGHYAGRPTMQKLGLIPEEITFPSYTSIAPQSSPYGACGHNKYWNYGEPLKTTLGMYGGFDAKPDEFPWSVMLLSATERQMCSGTVLSNNFVLTEGWCCQNWLQGGGAGVGGVVVYYGVGETGYPENFPTGTVIPPPKQYAWSSTAKSFNVHPSYSQPAAAVFISYDFCLVEVNNPVAFDSWKIQPICLPKSCDDTCKPGDYDLLSGFGLLNGDRAGIWNFLAKTNQFNTVPLISDADCQSILSRFNGLDLNVMFCAGYAASTGSNVGPGIGDDGTQLSCYKKGYFSLDGIMSLQFTSEPSFTPPVYGRVCNPSVLSWIYNLIPQLKA